MKYTLILAILLSGCTYNNRENLNLDILGEQEVNTVTIDSCQYLCGNYRGWVEGFWLTHKGNCNNPIHKQ